MKSESQYSHKTNTFSLRCECVLIKLESENKERFHMRHFILAGIKISQA